MMSNYYDYLPVYIIGLSLFASLVASSDPFFYKISEDVPQDVSAVFLPTGCTASGKTPHTMFTFEPADENDNVAIFTTPQDLVTFDYDRSSGGSSSRLTIQWNDDIAKDATEGGVRILFPPDQLKQVDVADKTKAQILDGFTKIESLSVSNKATLQATFTNLTVPIQMVSVTHLFSKATIISNAGFEQVKVSAFAGLTIQGDVHGQVSVSSYAGLNVRGNIDSGTVSDSGDLVIAGDVSGALSASSSATLSVKSISGSVSASSSATVHSSFSSDCRHVETSSGAKCKVSDIDDVTVEVDRQPFTLQGTDNKCYTSWTYVAVAAAGALFIVVGVMTCWWWRKKRKKRRHAAQLHDRQHRAISNKKAAAETALGATGAAPSTTTITEPIVPHAVIVLVPLDNKESTTDVVAVPVAPCHPKI